MDRAPDTNLRRLVLVGVVLPALLAAVIALLVFAGPGMPGDVDLLLAAHHASGPHVDRAMLALSWAGGAQARRLLLGALVILLVVRGQRRRVLFVGAGVGGAALLDLLLKLAFHRTRPHLWASIAPEGTYSFPSGHAMGTAAFATAIAVLAWETRARWPAVVMGASFAISVACSRVFLGVHYPSDVTAGLLLGVAWVLAVRALVGTDAVRRMVYPRADAAGAGAAEHDAAVEQPPS